MPEHAERIRLCMEGQPQDAAEAAALVFVNALKFCTQPETFPVFVEFTKRDNAAHDWVVQFAGALSPQILLAIEAQVAAGVVADFEAQS